MFSLKDFNVGSQLLILVPDNFGPLDARLD